MSDLFPADFRLERRRANGIALNVRYDPVTSPQRPPLLLLHGFPQTHTIWHAVAERLRRRFTLVLPDLRGYGDSDKPEGPPDHSAYSKRTMAQDVLELMRGLGFERFFVCGHDRGPMASWRSASRARPHCWTSHPLTMYERTTMEFAQRYYHWFFLIQPAPLPERLIGAEPLFYLRTKVGGWGSGGTAFFDPRALAEYERCFTDPAAIHAMCEDYRAAATIDLAHDRADTAQRIRCPVRVLWGERGVVHQLFTPVEDWRDKSAAPVSGRATPTGHYIPEEAPTLLAAEIEQFFGATAK
jgi:haloacetate dehalogenase